MFGLPTIFMAVWAAMGLGMGAGCINDALKARHAEQARITRVQCEADEREEWFNRGFAYLNLLRYKKLEQAKQALKKHVSAPLFFGSDITLSGLDSFMQCKHLQGQVTSLVTGLQRSHNVDSYKGLLKREQLQGAYELREGRGAGLIYMCTPGKQALEKYIAELEKEVAASSK